MREKLENIIHTVSPMTRDIGVTDGADLTSDLKLDSYDRIEAVMAIGVEFGIEIDEEKDFAKVRTFAELLELVDQKVREKANA